MILAASMVGCASLTDNEAIIRVQAAQNPVKAARLTLLGVKKMQHGDTDGAVQNLIAAIDADETYGPAHNNLGLLHYDQGNLYQAVLSFEQAMELMPYDPTVYYNLGLTLESAGKVHEAMDLYWQAVEMDPVNPYYLGNLVRLRVRLGEEGPDVIAQLQDLILIETRPQWRDWADLQLVTTFNDAIDRGPETPDFNTRPDRGSSTAEPNDNIIDLTPESEISPRDDDRSDAGARGDALFSNPKIVPSPEFNAPQVRSKPLPIQDTGSLEELPPSIKVREPDDYYR